MFTRGCAFSGPRLAEPLGVMKRGGFSRRGGAPDAQKPLSPPLDNIVQREVNIGRTDPVFAWGSSWLDLLPGAVAALGPGFFLPPI